MKITNNFEEVGRSLANLIVDYGRRVERDIETVMHEKAKVLREKIIEGWPVDTYRSRNAWQGPLKVGYAHFELRNDIPYAVIIETGGYRGVGPKTHHEGPTLLPGGIAVGGGIFPTQRPSHPVARAFSALNVEVRDELGKVLKQ